jgi:hypothetical protein
VPAESLSRVSSYDWMVSLLIFPAGSALAGPMADAFGSRSALLAFAALAGFPVLLVLLVPAVRAVRRRETTGALPAAAPHDERGAEPEPETVAA